VSPVDPALARVLDAAGLPATGRWEAKGGWVSRAFIGDEVVVRLGGDQARDAYAHEAGVIGLLAGSDVPHARHIAHGDGPDGAWYVSERLPGRSLQDAWPTATEDERRSIIDDLGAALRSLHRVPTPQDLRPPWLVEALAGAAIWPAYHPPVVGALSQLVEEARTTDRDPRLFDDVDAWVRERLPLFADDPLVLVHGDLHGSNVVVDGGRVSGIVDFAEAVAQPADVDLDTVLRWCARPEEFPATPDARGLDAASLADVPSWLSVSYPELFERPHLRDRLRVYDMWVELAIAVHHPDPDVRDPAEQRITALLAGRNHLDRLVF
jgi:hygromycin-B 7''-O-kinase